MDNNIAYLITWTETERGWGQRPDGYSLHLTPKAADQYVRDYNTSLPAGPAPDEYSFADSAPIAVQVTERLMRELRHAGGSQRFSQSQLVVEQGLTGARTVHVQDDESGQPFIELCLRSKANPLDLDEFVAAWEAGDKAVPLQAALGVTDAELKLIEANSANVFRVLYERQNEV